MQDKNTSQIYEHACGEYSSFLKVYDNGDFDNCLASELKPGEIIMRFGTSQGDSLFEIMRKLYNFDESIDFDIISLWKKQFHEGLENIRSEISKYNDEKKVTILDLYNKYVELCAQRRHEPKTYQSFLGWIRDKRIGPEEKEDVLILGIIGNFPNIQNQYEYIFHQMLRTRRLHMIIGKQVNKIVKAIMTHKEKRNLNFQEQLLYEKIHLYKVMKVMKNSTK